jgi:hypothetical protein
MQNQVPFSLPASCEVVGRVPVIEQGSFRREAFYITGINGKVPQELSNLGSVYFVDGWRGREARVIVDFITPIGEFNVCEA